MSNRNEQQTDRERNLVDYLLYTVAGTVVAAISFSFLLWLRF